jgi:hypothetical protein
MGDRINLQYTIDIDELAPEVQRLLHGAYDALEGIVIPLPSDILSLAAIEHIDDLRQRLMKVDFMLRDVNSIINAYVSYKAALAQESSAPADDNIAPIEETTDDESAPQE